MGMWVILIGDKNFNPDRIKTMSFHGAKEIKSYEHKKQFDIIYKSKRIIHR